MHRYIIRNDITLQCCFPVSQGLFWFLLPQGAPLRLSAWSHITVTQRISPRSQHSTTLRPPESTKERHTHTQTGELLHTGAADGGLGWRLSLSDNTQQVTHEVSLPFTGGCQVLLDNEQMPPHPQNSQVPPWVLSRHYTSTHLI